MSTKIILDHTTQDEHSNSSENTDSSQSLETEHAENNTDKNTLENTEKSQEEKLNIEESNINAEETITEKNITEENKEELAKEKEKIKNSLDKYITGAKGENIKIALIDSGVNVTTGSALTLAGGKSFVDDNYDKDENGHGTSLE